MKVRAKPRVAVLYNRDFEGAEADPENKAREDVKNVAVNVMRALGAHGYEVHGVGVTEDVHATVQALRKLGPGVAFNLCESLDGDNRFEALLPMLLDLEGLTYTGSGPLALALALHKHKAKDQLRARGVPTPAGFVVETTLDPGMLARVRQPGLRFPLFVKPAREDASVGICSDSVVRDPTALEARVRFVLERYRQPALVEEYIEGRELNVSVLERPDGPPEVLPLFEIDFSDMPSERPRIVSFEGKWVENSPEYRGTRPVRCEGLSPDVLARIGETALQAFTALDMRDYGRVDIRLSAEGVPYVIDVNPNCDLSSEGGGFARAACAAGLSYDQLILRLLALAGRRRRDADTVPLPVRTRRARTPDRPPDEQSVPAGGGVVRARAPRGRAEPAGG